MVDNMQIGILFLHHNTNSVCYTDVPKIFMEVEWKEVKMLDFWVEVHDYGPDSVCFT